MIRRLGYWLAAIVLAAVMLTSPGAAQMTITGRQIRDAQVVMNCRLTTESGVPVSSADQEDAQNVYVTPCDGDTVTCEDSAGALRPRQFTEITISLTGHTDGAVYDVFLVAGATGTVTAETLIWTSPAVRATGLTLTRGLRRKAGASTRMYVGSFYVNPASSPRTVHNASYCRGVWNAYNRVPAALSRVDGTDSWAYSTASWRQARATATNGVAFVRGLNEDPVWARVSGAYYHSTTDFTLAYVGIGVDSTTANSAQVISFHGAANTNYAPVWAEYLGHPGIGYHDLYWLEKGAGTGTQTWAGDAGTNGVGASGIVATVMY